MRHHNFLKKIFLALFYSVGVGGLFFLKLFLINLLPVVFTYIDIFMLFFVIAIMRGAHGKIIWFAFSIYFILDILSSQIFGIELFAGVFSVLGVYWFFEEVFTNLSIWTAGILTTFGMMVFKILYSIENLLASTITHKGLVLSLPMFRQFGIEILCTALISIPLYAIILKVSNMLTRERIRYS